MNGKDESHGSQRNQGSRPQRPSHNSHSSPHPPDSHPPPSIIPHRGDPRTLLSYQKAAVIYDITFRFARKLLQKGDRTIDQMIQSARSGKQNILEGSKAARTSKETEIKLTNVARASLDELLEDYLDYLRARDHAIRDKESPESQYVRRLGRKTPQTFELYREIFGTRPPEVLANLAICLIHQANTLLDGQLARLEQDFLTEGGLRERMARARLRARSQRQRPPNP